MEEEVMLKTKQEIVERRRRRRRSFDSHLRRPLRLLRRRSASRSREQSKGHHETFESLIFSAKLPKGSVGEKKNNALKTMKLH